MKILIFGATGPTGILLVLKCLGVFPVATLVLYARSPGKLPKEIRDNPAVTVIEGQLDDVGAMNVAMDGVDVVLSALGPTGPIYPSDTPLARAYELIIQLMKRHKARRLICLGTASIKDSNDQHNLTFAILIKGVKTLARNAYNDIVAIGENLRALGHDIGWTIVRVPLLTNSSSEEVVAGYVGDGVTKAYLSRAGFAQFVTQEMSKNEWMNKAPLVSSK
ncbi:hypothetical protein AX17_000422 [Amanita inopinata Kibby_2008]|nr:hypothetical protein AX17_000422 [Amanita inopinata Kibby_2008]